MSNIEVQIGSSPEDGSPTANIIIPAGSLGILGHALESYRLCNLPHEDDEDADWLGQVEAFIKQVEEAIENPIE